MSKNSLDFVGQAFLQEFTGFQHFYNNGDLIIQRRSYFKNPLKRLFWYGQVCVHTFMNQGHIIRLIQKHNGGIVE